MSRIGLAIVLVVGAGCGDHHAKPVDAATAVPDGMVDAGACGDCDAPIDANPLEPATLFGTGLCVDTACTQISADVQPYTPRYALWADAASKRRWIYVPPSAHIDTTDPDLWVFPQGTKLWKEFTTDASDGSVRLETRYIVKVGPGNTAEDWFYMPYQWNQTNDDTTAVPFGVPDANGTTHDIPSQSQCRTCHENLQPTRILGFGAIQLDYANPTTGELDLDHVIADGLLTTNPPGPSSPHYPLPSDPSDTYATDALGYLHANCGHCHNRTSNVYTNNNIAMVLRLDVADLATVQATPTYMTTIGQTQQASPISSDTVIVVAGDPGHSVMIDRFESTNSAIWMPQIGHKTMDPDGDTLLKNWITNLQ